MFAAVPHRMLPYAKEGFLGQEATAGSEPLAHAELWGGLERDLECLQGMLDGAVETLRLSFAGMNDAVVSGSTGERLRAQFSGNADRAVTCLQFHDVASQMITNIRRRAELLEIAALAAAPDALVKARSRTLSDALCLSKSRPGLDFDRSGDVDLS